MKIYFAPCGIGLGHVGRCIPIAKILAKKNEVVFSTYREGIEYIQQQKFTLLKAPEINFQVKNDGSIDFRKTAVNPGPFLSIFTFIKQLKAEIKNIQGLKPNIVISDSRISPLLASKILAVPRICILNQFQVIIPRRKRFLRLAKFADMATLTIIGKIWANQIVLIPDFPKPYTICGGNLNIPKSYKKNIRFIGPILPQKPNELPPKNKLRDKLKLSSEKIVIFVPISGPTKEKEFLIKILRKELQKISNKYQIIISLGRPNSNGKSIREEKIRIYEWLPNRFEYLKASDLVISRAGHGTITQCMHYGKPMILIPTPNHTEQFINSKQAENLGIATILNQNGINTETLTETIQQSITSEKMHKSKKIEQAVFKFDGLKEAVKLILKTSK